MRPSDKLAALETQLNKGIPLQLNHAYIAKRNKEIAESKERVKK